MKATSVSDVRRPNIFRFVSKLSWFIKIGDSWRLGVGRSPSPWTAGLYHSSIDSARDTTGRLDLSKINTSNNDTGGRNKNVYSSLSTFSFRFRCHENCEHWNWNYFYYFIMFYKTQLKIYCCYEKNITFISFGTAKGSFCNYGWDDGFLYRKATYWGHTSPCSGCGCGLHSFDRFHIAIFCICRIVPWSEEFRHVSCILYHPRHWTPNDFWHTFTALVYHLKAPRKFPTFIYYLKYPFMSLCAYIAVGKH